MNIGSKSDSNNLQSFFSQDPKSSTTQNNLSSKCAKCGRVTNSNEKNKGNNEWSSVPITYDKEESTQKHRKSAGNNQWTSTSK